WRFRFRQPTFLELRNDRQLIARVVRGLFSALQRTHITRPPRFVCWPRVREAARCTRLNNWGADTPEKSQITIPKSDGQPEKRNAPAPEAGARASCDRRSDGMDYSAPRNASRSPSFPPEKSMLKR